MGIINPGKDELNVTGELSAILAHEIKNPMNSIIINMEVLRSSVLELTGQTNGPAAQRAKKYLDVIEGEIRRLDKVIRGFLEFAHPPQSTKIKLKLNQIVQSTYDLMANELKQKKIHVKLELSPEAPSFIGSSDQIKQALLNLMVNAIQAMPGGGTITIQTSVDARFARLCIVDTGRGIEEKVIGNIFNPYFTTKAKGSGIGLTVVRHHVRDHGGDIEVQSEIGKGAQFVLNFPVISGESNP